MTEDRKNMDIVRGLKEVKASLITLAGNLVRCDDIPSWSADDYPYRVPKKLLMKLDLCCDAQRSKANRLRVEIDKINHLLNQLTKE